MFSHVMGLESVEFVAMLVLVVCMLLLLVICIVTVLESRRSRRFTKIQITHQPPRQNDLRDVIRKEEAEDEPTSP